VSRSARPGSLRVIAGSAKGRRLRSLPGIEVRPTLDRVRQAVFSSLGGRVVGAHFLDLFAGTGAVGIEALSRGAKQAVFVDSSKRCCRVLRQNLETCGLTAGACVCQADWKAVLGTLGRSHGAFDIAYLDPPYDRYDEGPILAAVTELLAPDGQLLFEHLLRQAAPERAGTWQCVRTLRYGQTAISWYASGKGLVDRLQGPP
jgi:16S rRNA (guanine(966)-N(2))-methyltransferase RsmD